MTDQQTEINNALKPLLRGYRSNKYLDSVRPNVHLKQRWFLSMEHLEVMYGGAGGGGKSDALLMAALQYALDVDTLIPNPYGWVTVKDIKVGDTIYSPDGNPTKVTHVTEVYNNSNCYKLNFNDGDSIISDENHKWPVYSFTDRLKLKKQPQLAESIVTTKKLFETQKTNHKRPSTNWSIRPNKAVKYPKANLIVDPYILGAWLGDGSTKNGTMAGIDIEIRNEFEKAGYETKTYGEHQWYVGRLQTDLGMLGVLNNKHVPLQYLRGSIKQRLSLLQGLMDTDGSVSKEYGGCTFFNTNPKLVEAVVELVRSLGWVACISSQRYVKRLSRKVGEGQLVCFNAHVPVFRLPRKISRQKMMRKQFRYITSIEKVISRPVKCITVDNLSHQFLCGAAYTRTHNCDIPGYSAIIFRNSFKDLNLPNAIMHRANSWLSGIPGCRKCDGGQRWEFDCGNGKVSTLQFAYMESELDKERYKSAEFQFCGFDESSTIPFACYTYMFTRMRKPSDPNDPLSHVPLRMRSATNPNGKYIEDIKNYFVPKAYLRADEDEQFSKVWSIVGKCGVCDGKKTIEIDNEYVACKICKGTGKFTRYFVPARIKDNPSMDYFSYKASLSHATTEERAALEHGRWDLTSDGKIFRSAWIRRFCFQGDHIILKKFDGPGGHKLIDSDKWYTFITADTAQKIKTVSDYTCIVVWACCLPNYEICRLQIVRQKMLVPHILPKIKEMYDRWNCRFVYIEEQSSGIALIQEGQMTDRGSGLNILPYVTGTVDKVTRSTNSRILMEGSGIFFRDSDDTIEIDCTNELLSFPDGVHDDYVDCQTMAADYVMRESRHQRNMSGSTPGTQARQGLVFPRYNRY